MRATVPSLPPLRRSSETLVTDVSRHLEHLIVSGHLPDGARLPAERELSLQLGVSRTVLREALGHLQLLKLIDRRHGSGSVVTAPLATPSRSGAPPIPVARGLRDAAELRLIVEPKLAELAAQRADVFQIAAMQGCIDEARELLSPDRSLELDVMFHALLAESTGNELLENVARFAADRFTTVRAVSHRSADGRAASLRGHRAILAAIMIGDAAGAAVQMRDHIAEISIIIAATDAPSQRPPSTESPSP